MSYNPDDCNLLATGGEGGVFGQYRCRGPFLVNIGAEQDAIELLCKAITQVSPTGIKLMVANCRRFHAQGIQQVDCWLILC